MGYRTALEAAGAVVHDMRLFGSYQGDWWADVTWKGQRGFVTGSFGSCSYCDAFGSEFGYDEPTEERLMLFGKDYLEDLKTPEQAIEIASRNLDWDCDAKDMVSWIKNCVNSEVN